MLATTINTMILGFLGFLLQLNHSTATSTRDSVSNYVHHKSSNLDAALRYINNSGVCETTEGVHTASGYIEIAQNQSLWFWFFAARESPETAPFTLWLNGGPGCSSMIGLFQENGPCHVNSDSTTTVINPFSWNNVSNMLYIDQPVGTGFSFGTDPVNSTESAAPPVWTALQLFFEDPSFSKYRSREFIFATESYGGHYGPAFVTYFDQQNGFIETGKISGEKITVSALMINNGWYDPLLQYRSYIDFAANAPGYGPLINESLFEQLNATWFSPTGCLAQELACYAAGTDSESNTICHTADNACSIIGDRDDDDLRQTAPGSFPPEYYVAFLNEPQTIKQIGARGTYSECPDAPFNKFEKTGDDARTWLPELSALVNSGLRVLLWAGDADINCNWLGGHAVALAMDWYGKERLQNTPFTNITIDGSPVAAVQNVDMFSFARVYQSGHEVPAFQPQAAFEIFKQVIAKEPLHSVVTGR